MRVISDLRLWTGVASLERGRNCGTSDKLILLLRQFENTYPVVVRERCIDGVEIIAALVRLVVAGIAAKLERHARRGREHVTGAARIDAPQDEFRSLVFVCPSSVGPPNHAFARP